MSDLLECDASDLEVYGWQPYVHKESAEAIATMARELGMLRAGQYHLNARARSGDQLHMRIRTLVLHGPEAPRIHGAVDLVQWRSIRRHLDLKSRT